MVTLNCPNLHFSIPQEDILNDNSSEAMLQSCHRMSGLPLRRKPLRHDVQLVKFRHQRLAENPRHVHFDGVADKFFLLFLRADQYVVLREAHDPLQFRDTKHPHPDVHQSVQRHELLYLHQHRRIFRVNLVNQRFVLQPDERGQLLAVRFGSHQPRRPLVHAGDQRETRPIGSGTRRGELRVHQVLPFAVGRHGLGRSVERTADVAEVGVHNPRRDEPLLRVRHDGRSRAVRS